MPWGRFEARLAGKVVAADPAVAAAREADRVAEQFAKRTRSSEQGTAGFYVRSTVGVIARLDATVAFLADALAAFGDRDPEDLRRVKAVALLANPVRAVELLAAFAALRADRRPRRCRVDRPDPLDEPDAGTSADGTCVDTRKAAAATQPGRRWTRMDALRPPGRVHPTPAARAG